MPIHEDIRVGSPMTMSAKHATCPKCKAQISLAQIPVMVDWEALQRAIIAKLDAHSAECPGVAVSEDDIETNPCLEDPPTTPNLERPRGL